MNAVPRGFWTRITLAWLGVALILIVRTWTSIHDFQLADPDDALRLVQVRDLLAGQHWFDAHQYRIDPPAGVATHWSRLVDTPLALLILALRPFLGQPGAELAAAVIVPLLTLLCAMLLTARIAVKLFGERAAYAACLVWIMALAAMAQLQPMRIDHHGWQIVAELAAINGLLSPSARRGGWTIGIALGIGLSISLELLPFAVLFAAILGLRWLIDPRQRGWLVQMLAALALTSLASFFATRGAAFDLHCDTVTPAYLIAFTLAALLVGLIARFEALSRIAIVVLLGLAAALTGAVYLALSPACLAGPFAALDPVVRQVWYNNVLEGMPVWRQEAPSMVQMLVPPLAGLAIAALTWLGASNGRRAMLRDFTLVLAGSLTIAVLVARFSGVAAAIATIPLGYAISEWLRRASEMKLAARLLVLPLIMLVLVPGFAAGKLRDTLAPPPVDPQGEAPVLGRGCSLPGSLPALDSVPPSTLFAPFEIGPTLLLQTRHSVIATGHHRAAAAMSDVINAYLADPAMAEAIVRRHGARYVIACSDLIEARNYAKFAPKGLMADLLVGKTPTWLEPVQLPTDAGELKLWKVRP
ncbi:hypothetical protein [Novosphingobium sp.]|uniref:hypothetical protein n=1 Tax=Novosphingobium sp. TaxID=1874826 RepID=UPI0025DBFEAC|nr:hypothetical protein [Novosphingobium sp.]MCC6926682.1 hypothetical protein [Novosphingobium sp.]